MNNGCIKRILQKLPELSFGHPVKDVWLQHLNIEIFHWNIFFHMAVFAFRPKFYVKIALSKFTAHTFV